jgi:hypothetical protein
MIVYSFKTADNTVKMLGEKKFFLDICGYIDYTDYIKVFESEGREIISNFVSTSKFAL